MLLFIIKAKPRENNENEYSKWLKMEKIQVNIDLFQATKSTVRLKLVSR